MELSGDFCLFPAFPGNCCTRFSEEQVFVNLADGQVSEPRLAGDGKGNFFSVYSSTTISGGLQIGTNKIVTPSFLRLFLLGLPAQLNGSNK
ncbi:MAG: hypothetical protein KKD01_04485 [Proteobacteria bacterium]|nr:hypothetical protein [Pseudomonadota bacterium]MBU1232032.1 hypothetical protein [Pseudomonadota bacterium]MBU1417292.1 hypothetical protein [Pseudomonadota bacterium]MBU1453965.1 hypothetical protein [Pseudomonadota bacterium]